MEDKDHKTVEEAKVEYAKKAHETARDQTGACVYNAGGKTHCAVLTQSACSFLGGAWFPGKPCT